MEDFTKLCGHCQSSLKSSSIDNTKKPVSPDETLGGID
jgi:hypothetical protein